MNLHSLCWKRFPLRNCLRYFANSTGQKKVCVVGSGPAGFYTAQHILKNNTTEVDIFEKLPVPFGLIRYGVAPDHPEIKVVTNTFTKVITAGRCNFFGNVTVGRDISVNELLDAYDAVVLAYGADKDKILGIPGENAKNVLSAKKFVGWYNGLPEDVNEQVNLDKEVAVVIGHGNVALDVARILLRDINELKETDIADHALEALSKSKIKKVILVGRRGPLQVAFTIKEFRELTKLANCKVTCHYEDMDRFSAAISSLPRPRKRLMELIYTTVTENKNAGSKLLELKFCRSPQLITSDVTGSVEKLVLGINKLDSDSENSKVVKTDQQEIIECGLILKSVGYQSIMIDPSVSFDERKNVIPNENGKVINKNGLYCSGWVKTGPVGVILSTMYGSYETAEKLLKDIDSGELELKNKAGRESILKLLKTRGVKVTTFNNWLEIDKVEQERGKALGKSRQKIYSTDEMLKISGL